MKLQAWVAIGIGVAGMTYAAFSVIAAKPLFGNSAVTKKPGGVSQYETNVLSRAVSMRRDPFHAAGVIVEEPGTSATPPSSIPQATPSTSVTTPVGPPIPPAPVQGDLNPAPVAQVEPLPQPTVEAAPPRGGMQDPSQPGTLDPAINNPAAQTVPTKRLMVKAIVASDQVLVYFELDGKILPAAGENAEPVKGLRIHHLSSESFLMTAGGKTTRYRVGEEVPLP